MSTLSLFSTGLILFLVALAFLAAELFVPTHGLLAIFCALFAVSGIVCMFRANFTAGVLAAFICAVLAPFTFYYYLKMYPNTPVGKRVILARPKSTLDHSPQQEFLNSLPGRQGIAVTPLRPAGAIEIDGKRIDCVAESEIIDAGSTVLVQRVAGMKVIVTKLA